MRPMIDEGAAVVIDGADDRKNSSSSLISNTAITKANDSAPKRINNRPASSSSGGGSSSSTSTSSTSKRRLSQDSTSTTRPPPSSINNRDKDGSDWAHQMLRTSKGRTGSSSIATSKSSSSSTSNRMATTTTTTTSSTTSTTFAELPPLPGRSTAGAGQQQASSSALPSSSIGVITTATTITAGNGNGSGGGISNQLLSLRADLASVRREKAQLQMQLEETWARISKLKEGVSIDPSLPVSEQVRLHRLAIARIAPPDLANSEDATAFERTAAAQAALIERQQADLAKAKTLIAKYKRHVKRVKAKASQRSDAAKAEIDDLRHRLGQEKEQRHALEVRIREVRNKSASFDHHRPRLANSDSETEFLEENERKEEEEEEGEKEEEEETEEMGSGGGHGESVLILELSQHLAELQEELEEAQAEIVRLKESAATAETRPE